MHLLWNQSNRVFWARTSRERCEADIHHNTIDTLNLLYAYWFSRRAAKGQLLPEKKKTISHRYILCSCNTIQTLLTSRGFEIHNSTWLFSTRDHILAIYLMSLVWEVRFKVILCVTAFSSKINRQNTVANLALYLTQMESKKLSVQMVFIFRMLHWSHI